MFGIEVSIESPHVSPLRNVEDAQRIAAVGLPWCC